MRIKRIIDVLAAAIGLIVTAPVLLAASIGTVVTSGFPVFFLQQRLGRGNRAFVILKLRTMHGGTAADGTLLPDAQRLTRWGMLLRKSSIDELPQLWNVLKGEMSLVGPRPLLASYKDRYSEVQLRRHEVAPGLTGWAQVNGRNNTTWDEKFQMDVWYVDHLSLALDIRILALTVLRVLRSDGFSEVSEHEFQGSGSGRNHVSQTVN